MWIEKTLLKRKASSSDAITRQEAVAAMECKDYRELLGTLAASDLSPEVRLAAIEKLDDWNDLEPLKRTETDPVVLRGLQRRLDSLYSEAVLTDEIVEGETADVLDRIASPEVLVATGLRAVSDDLVLSIGAKLAGQDAWLRKLLVGLTKDSLALELYSRLSVDAAFDDELLCYAKSAALRDAIAAERARRQAAAERQAQELAMVEEAEALALQPDAAKFDDLVRRWSMLESPGETLKERFMAAKYRHCQALEEALALAQAQARDHALAERLTAEMEQLVAAENWKAGQNVVANWRNAGLDDASGAAEFKARFVAAAQIWEDNERRVRAAEELALDVARKIHADFSTAWNENKLPELSARKAALDELARVVEVLSNLPAELVDLKEKILGLDRDFRRRAHAESQVRDLARWEHYTLKMDICLELEKLTAVPDDGLVNAARRFRQLRDRWNAIGPVPNEKFEELRDRYRGLCAQLHERFDRFFKEREIRCREAEAAKLEICAEAEDLSGSEDWEKTSDLLKSLQARWKELPGAVPARERELFARFHSACDSFFVRRNAAWESRKRGFMAAVARKRELCEMAEALKTEPFFIARKKIGELRELWKDVPSAGRDDRLLYTEFNRIIDGIFANHREAEDETRRRSEIICTGLIELAENARSGRLTLEEIERGLADNNREWDLLSGRPAPEAIRRRDSALRELKARTSALRHDAAQHRLEEALHLEEFADPGLDDAKLADHLERRLKVCQELENRLRECRILDGGDDLAGELELAIAGNFGGANFDFSTAELDEFLRRFVVIGPVPATEREAVFARFGGLYNRAMKHLSREGGGDDAQ